MNRNNFLKMIWQSVFFWTLAMLCYAMFRYFGAEDEVALTLREGYDINRLLIEPLLVFSIFGLALGVLYAFVDSILEKNMPKKISMAVTFLIKTSLYFVAIIIIATIIGIAASQFLEANIDFNLGWWIHEKRFWSVLFFILISSFVFTFIKIATERFGRGVFLKMLVGAYSNPREEERIFMFLDLKDSTTIAEKLGHHKYSQFIQDCFLDLNKIVLKYDAEIYQYVGDEAVLSWQYERGLINNNCIGLFFAFQEQRESRKDYYLQKYGVYPEFKAGLHGGSLMVAEVGSVKKELAYHGDVINTSARIQAECNTHNATLILSEKLLKDLNIEDLSTSKSLGNVLLKGKHEEVKIHSIERKSQEIKI